MQCLHTSMLSDMAPNACGINALDHQRIMVGVTITSSAVVIFLNLFIYFIWSLL